MNKIAYLTGTRAEFGLMQKILKAIEAESKLELLLIATGMHLLPEFGQTINEVKQKFPQVKIIEATYKEDSRLSMAQFLGDCTKKIVEALSQEKPDLVLMLGDRAEQLAMATAAAYLAIPIIHLHGGESTTTIDDKARNAISMLADWHLPACKSSRKKLIKMGIDKKRVQVVGAPGLDQIRQLPVAATRDLIIVLQHPDQDEAASSQQIRETLAAVIGFKLKTKVIYPNADAGGRAMIQVIEDYAKKYPNLLETFPSIKREEFLKLLSRARVLVGNSSAGLIEAPALNLPAVNIGPRQKGRERTKNVVDAKYNRKSIAKAISKALGMNLKNLKNPYGDGKTTDRVIKFLKNL